MNNNPFNIVYSANPDGIGRLDRSLRFFLPYDFVLPNSIWIGPGSLLSVEARLVFPNKAPDPAGWVLLAYDSTQPNPGAPDFDVDGKAMFAVGGTTTDKLSFDGFEAQGLRFNRGLWLAALPSTTLMPNEFDYPYPDGGIQLTACGVIIPQELQSGMPNVFR